MVSLKVLCSISCFVLLFTTSIVQGIYFVYVTKIRHWKVVGVDIILATWEEALQNCQNQGATLASPTDEELFDTIKSVIEDNDDTNQYFIRTKAKEIAEIQFVAEKGILLNTTSTAVGVADLQDDDCLSMDQKNIRVVSCSQRLAYMCQKDVNETATPKTFEPFCGNGYKLYESGSCYMVYNNVVTWDSANQTCSEDGGYLVVINDYIEAEILLELSRVSKENSDQVVYAFWTGVRKEAGSDSYRTVNGEDVNKVYFLRMSDYLQDSDTKCGIFDVNQELSTRICDSVRFPFICEKKYGRHRPQHYKEINEKKNKGNRAGTYLTTP